MSNLILALSHHATHPYDDESVTGYDAIAYLVAIGVYGMAVGAAMENGLWKRRYPDLWKKHLEIEKEREALRENYKQSKKAVR